MAIIASALRFSNDTYYEDSIQEAIESYAKESWVYILKQHMTNDNSPDIHVVQAASILAIIDFAAGRTSSGWLKIGLAVRISQDLRLMQEPDNSLPPAEQEERRRVFWSVFLLDRLVSCGESRPLAIQEEDCHVQLPCDEETFQAGVWKKTATLKQVLTWKTGDQVEGLCSNFALVILAATALGRCAKHVLQDREMDNVRPHDHKPLPLGPDCLLMLVDHHLQMQGPSLDTTLAQYRKLDGMLDDQVRDRILWLDSYVQSFATLLDPTTDYNPEPATASMMRVMVDYGAMCNSPGVVDGIKEAPTPNTSRMLSMLDFDMGFDHLGENYGGLSEDSFSLLEA
ncbi:hypothetical protein NW759_011202 [Fusarium solani]|nr:hypothetical protein NW759_011202 [Fusarium solani]